MSSNPNWPRWIRASLVFALKQVVASENDAKALVEGDDERTQEFTASPLQVEIRFNGPLIRQEGAEYRVWVDGNVLITQAMGEGNTHDLDRIAGLYQSAMSGAIPVFNYGNKPGDYFGDPAVQTQLGCLRPKPGKNDGVNVYHFGQVDQNDRIRQAAVDCRFEIYL